MEYGEEAALPHLSPVRCPENALQALHFTEILTSWAGPGNLALTIIPVM